MIPAGDREEVLFREAIQRPEGPERQAFLDQACAGDPVLRARLGALVQVHENPARFLEETTVALPHEGPGTLIGRYKILEKIGEGGFGIVYVAEQREPVKRRVALKIIKLGMDTRQVVARFEAERQALALMDHPNIAKVFDAGATDTGRPYFVMELVKGVPITHYCEQEKTELTERLRLFVQTCHAIQHAHQKGIIHRDIKPSNILVTLHDGVPVPKVIDFGIAKATQQELTEKTIYTQFQQFIGTPAYMSPEQAEMSGLDIDTRSDIYSLGVLLYELLTGCTPFDTQELLKYGLDEMRKIIREREPVRPSTRLRQTGSIRASRSAPEPRLSPVATDLDWIVMKCLEKDRRRRYETANGVAQDIARHLEHEPVAARPPSTLYRVQKFVRRNKVTVSAATLVAGALVLGILGSSWQAVRATRAEGEQKVLRKAAEKAEHTAVEARGVAEQESARAKKAAERLRINAYASDMKAAQVAIQQNNRGLAADLLLRHLPKSGETDLRGIEWRYLWRESHGLESHSFLHSSMVKDAAFSPDGRLLATMSFEKICQVWDIASEKRIAEFQGGGGALNRCVAFTPDGRKLLYLGNGRVEIVETSGWKPITNVPCRTGLGSSFVLSRNGRRLVFRGNDAMEAWDLENWQCQKKPGLDALMYSLAVNAEGTFAVLSTAFEGRKAPVYLWNITANITNELGTSRDVESFAFSPDGRWLASGHASGHLELWELKTPRPRGPFLRWRAHYRELYALAFSPDGARLASGGSDQRIVIWRTGTTNIVGELTGHGGMIDVVCFSTDGKRLVSASRDNTAKIWDWDTCLSAEDGRHPRLPSTALPVCVNSSGTGMFTLQDNQNSVSLRSLQSGEPLWSFSSGMVADAGCPDLSFFLKQQVALGFSTNGVLHMWELGTGKLLRSVPLAVGSLRPASLSHDKRWLVVGGWAGGVRLFDLQEGKAVPGSGSDRMTYTYVADFSPDGRLLACSFGDPNSDIHIWDLQSGKEAAVCRGHPMVCYALRFSPDSKILASGDWGGNLMLWSVETGKPLWPTLKGHDAVLSCCFSADGKTVITGDPNASLRFWSIASGQEMLSISDTFPLAEDLMIQHGFLYRGQVEVNPTPDLLVWQELDGRTRLSPLPSLTEIDTRIVREQEQSSKIAHETANREREQAAREAERLARVARDPGAIKQWLVLGPIPLPPGQSEVDLLDTELIPNEARLRPRAGERVSTPGAELTWGLARQADYTLDFHKLAGPAEHAAAYAVCYLSVPSTRSDLKMLVGNDDQAKIYLNSKQVYRQAAAREVVPDQDNVSGINLEAGTNVLVFKVLNVTGPWGGSIRFTDSAGAPVSDLSVHISPP